MSPRVLVVHPADSDPVGRLGDWLTTAGLDLDYASMFPTNNWQYQLQQAAQQQQQYGMQDTSALNMNAFNASCRNGYASLVPLDTHMVKKTRFHRLEIGATMRMMLTVSTSL